MSKKSKAVIGLSVFLIVALTALNIFMMGGVFDDKSENAFEPKYQTGRDTRLAVGDCRFEIIQASPSKTGRTVFSLIDRESPDSIDPDVFIYHDDEASGKLFVVGSLGYTAVDYGGTGLYEQHSELSDFSEKEQRIFENAKFCFLGSLDILSFAVIAICFIMKVSTAVFLFGYIQKSKNEREVITGKNKNRLIRGSIAAGALTVAFIVMFVMFAVQHRNLCVPVISFVVSAAGVALATLLDGKIMLYSVPFGYILGTILGFNYDKNGALIGYGFAPANSLCSVFMCTLFICIALGIILQIVWNIATSVQKEKQEAD